MKPLFSTNDGSSAMSAAPARGSLVALGLIVSMAVVGVLAGDGQEGAYAPPAGRGEGEIEKTRRYITADDCARCHYEGSQVSPLIRKEESPPAKKAETAKTAKPQGSPTAKKAEAAKKAQELFPLVRLNESQLWNDHDRHRKAFDALTRGGRGEQIGRLMGIADVTKAQECLSCHSTGFFPEEQDAMFRADAEQYKELGVSCIACHGAYDEWFTNHFRGTSPNRAWRSKSAQTKQSEFGMTDLRDPATRSATCYACHIGKAAEGKVVTHRMYAAGHPPLPGIEVATFSQAMPPHWWDPADVPLFREDPASGPLYHYDPSESRQTKLAVIGGVVALRDSMNLLRATMAPGRSDANPAQGAWPDFAAFDCYACHHDLQAPGFEGWRQSRGDDSRPPDWTPPGVRGRPQVRPWPFALARLGLAQVESLPDGRALRAEFEKGVAALNKAYRTRPFGNSRAVAEAAKGLVAWSERLLQALGGTTFDQASPARLLKALTIIPEEESPDYDSARQIAWAFRTIFSEWKPLPSNSDRIRSMLGEMDTLLKLEPNIGREDDLMLSLARAAEYDPRKFKQKLGELSALLPDVAKGQARR